MRGRRLFLFGLVLLASTPLVAGLQNEPKVLRPSGRVGTPAIDELSGLVGSDRYPGVFWVHNDSGDRARIFAIRSNGRAVTPNGLRSTYQGITVKGAKNVDWEDIARNGNTLYLSDMGNNNNARRDLGVYAIKEPDPTRDTEITPLAFYPIRYPDQTDFPPKGAYPFDCEAIFFLRGKLYFVTKHRINRQIPAGSAALYRLDTYFTDRPNVLTKLDESHTLGGWVTAADVSPDGRTLAVLSQTLELSVWLFNAHAKGDRFLSSSRPRRISFTGTKQCEAIAFADNDTLIVRNEQRDLYQVKVKSAR